MTTIRPAAEEDIDRIASVFLRCWTDSYRDVVQPDEIAAWTAERATNVWSDHVRSGRTAVLVADDDGKVLGVARHHDGVLDSLYVDPDASGRGIGRALVHAVLEREGARDVQLWVFESNAAARAFYGRIGFMPDGRRRRDPGYSTEEIGMTHPGRAAR
jgi:ribosomal protein S18 acetylase RimI-like enzyme